ncbi:hypothetical protein [Acerihabitans arboris]|uniref:Uncharacterized protein n=1 Tax=Acerihabitans arboris TaxID=2691583 RepID=A0A845SJS8_9GAMM|nr:hypothetical protein [Acerihabitans arboris]NDL62891.1 hypothetical protein [Acerihabitans arboris]
MFKNIDISLRTTMAYGIISFHPTISGGMSYRRFFDKITAVSDAGVKLGNTSKNYNYDLTENPDRVAGPFTSAPGLAHNEKRSLLKKCMGRMADNYRQVRNSITEVFSPLLPENSFADYQKTLSAAQNRRSKLTIAVNDFHIRKVHEDLLNKHLKTIKNDEKAFNEWKRQESRTYIGALINKRIDDFINQPQGVKIFKIYSENCKPTLTKDGPKEIWSNEIYKILGLDSRAEHKNDIHILANPTIYKAVFEYFYHPGMDSTHPKRVNDKIYIWQASNKVYSRIFKDMPSPERILEESDKYLQALDKSFLSAPGKPGLPGHGQSGLPKLEKPTARADNSPGRESGNKARRRFLDAMLR